MAGTEEPTFPTTVRMPRRLSPSRMSDFLSCPLKFRYRVIDRLPEPPSPTAVRGTVVHEVLDRLFDRPATERDVRAAIDLLPEAWRTVRESDARARDLFDDPAEERLWLQSAEAFLESYFSLEDPARLEPAERELKVELPLESGVLLNGVLDRLDEAPDGRIRIVDYKTGKAPAERYQDQAMMQMKIYGLAIWKLRGVLPTVLALYYLGDSTVLSLSPTQSELELVEKRVAAIWDAIEAAVSRGTFASKAGPLCQFCSFKEFCPAFDGVSPPLPQIELV